METARKQKFDGSIELSFEIYESFIPIRVEVELFRSKGSLSYSMYVKPMVSSGSRSKY